jgi:hypothetical protein
MAWSAAAKHRDVDALVLTSTSHVVREKSPDGVPVDDPGYLTTNAGMRRFFYYGPNADPPVIAAHEAHEDLSTAEDGSLEAVQRNQFHSPWQCRLCWW